MYVARKNVLENRAITPILKGEMYFATETSLDKIQRLWINPRLEDLTQWLAGQLNEAVMSERTQRLN